MTKMENSENFYKQALELESKKLYSEALTVYKELINLGEDPRFYIAYGVCLQKMNHWETSITMLEKGISLKPHYGESDARLALAESYLQTGKKKKAIAQWRIVEQMPSEYPSYEHPLNKAKELLKKHA